MTRAMLFLLCGLLGGVAGGLIVPALRSRPPARAPRASRSGTADPEARARIELLERRLDALAAHPSARLEPGPGKEAPAPATGSPAPSGTKKGPVPAEGEGLAQIVHMARTTPMGPKATKRLFGWLTLHKETIPGMIRSLRAAIKQDPGNAELRVALATTLVAQLTNTTPPGPQQGLVWGQAAAAYDAAIKIDPGHWQARFGKALGTTFIPRQFGQQPYAIKQFEELRRIQEGRAPQPEYAETYYQLGLLYKDQGNVDKARKIWQEGRTLFPEDRQLKDQLEVTTQR